MNLKQLINSDDRAVSPVIGVILMVAITVILAAVIASLTLGLGDSAQTAPTAKFNFDQSAGEVVVSHQSGATIDGDRLSWTVDGDSASASSPFGTSVQAGSTAKFTVGDPAVIGNGTVKVGQKINLVWSSEDGGTSSTLATYTVE